MSCPCPAKTVADYDSMHDKPIFQFVWVYFCTISKQAPPLEGRLRFNTDFFVERWVGKGELGMVKGDGIFGKGNGATIFRVSDDRIADGR